MSADGQCNSAVIKFNNAIEGVSMNGASRAPMMARIAQFNVMVRSLTAVHVLRRFIAEQFVQSASIVN